MTQTLIKQRGTATWTRIRAASLALMMIALPGITVTVADKGGLMVPRSKNVVKFEVTGPGEIFAMDNGDATSFESFQAHERKAYHGLALVIVRATKP